MRMKARSWLFASLAVVTALLAAGCTQDAGDPNPAGTRNPSSASDAADEIARSSDQIDIGGRSLHLQCWGEPAASEPTVLLITGHGPTTTSWEPFARAFASEGHHLCSYDRAGVGGATRRRSPAAPRRTR